MSSLYQNFFKNVHNQTVLYLDENVPYTAQDLKRKISEIYQVMIQQPTVTYVAICTGNRFLLTASLFALIYAKKVPVVLGHVKEKLLAEQRYLFDGIVTDQSIEVDSKIFMIANGRANDELIDNALFEQYIADQKIILMTSGSSSEPKKVIKSVQYLEAETALLMKQWGDVLQGKIVLSTVSPLHQYGITFNILLPLIAKAIIHNSQLFYQEELAQFDRQSSYALITSPAFLKRLDKMLVAQLNLDLIFSAGGALGSQGAHDCFQVFKQWPIEIYGSSESGVIAYNQHNDTADYLFLPFEQIVVQQYEDETIKVISPLFSNGAEFRLNDRIEIMNDGAFRILGRTDKVVKIEEKRISLTEIETRVKSSLSIDAVFAFVLPSGNRDIIGCVIVGAILKTQERQIITTLTRELRQYIEPIAVPKRWRFVAVAPMNAQGKVSLSELRELFND